MEATVKVFDRWGVRRTGLFTFPQSAKHVGLYQKFGYWPGALTALMRLVPQPRVAPITKNVKSAVLLSTLVRAEQDPAIRACAKLADGLSKGLDLGKEIAAVRAQHIGEAILLYGRNSLDAFAVCMHGAGSEGGAKTVYVKFAAARGGDRFTRLLDAIESFALERGADVEAGVSFNCVDAFRRMQAQGYRAFMQGIAMQRPHGEGFNRPGAYVLGDWR
jgi:hypothetical protein